jgi:hypothetical protein
MESSPGTIVSGAERIVSEPLAMPSARQRIDAVTERIVSGGETIHSAKGGRLLLSRGKRARAVWELDASNGH